MTFGKVVVDQNGSRTFVERLSKAQASQRGGCKQGGA
jgi:hypothetical protein